MRRRVLAAVIVGLAAAVLGPEPLAKPRAVPGTPDGSQAPRPTAAQQHPVFRGGTEFIRVDAYPSKDGKIIQGLTADDFQVFEDGRPQTIDSFDYITFPTWTPDQDRLHPDSDQSGFDLAVDPRYRVFVIVVDTFFSGKSDVHNAEKPLVTFVERTVGPHDLFGFLTTRNTAKDLILSQQTAMAESLIDDLFQSANTNDDEAEDFNTCHIPPNTLDALKTRFRADQTYTALESLVAKLGSLRQERKNIIFVSDSISRSKPAPDLKSSLTPAVPRAGVIAGVLGGGRQTPAEAPDRSCTTEALKLINLDFDSRYRGLLDDARRQNVAFYPIAPEGVTPQGTTEHADLRSLASDTGGLAIVDTNDLDGGLHQIADDLSSYYLLGYYTTNTHWDGQPRTITVRLKSTGEIVRARPGYRAPTADDIAALAAGRSPKTDAPSDEALRESALSVLGRGSGLFAVYAARAGGSLTVVTELTPQALQSGRWKDGANLEIALANETGDILGNAHGRIGGGAVATVLTVPVTGAPVRASVRVRDAGGTAADGIPLGAPGVLVGDPLVYRWGIGIANRPVADFEFGRNERIRIDWPVLAPLDRHEARLLDRNGHPIPVELPIADDPAHKTITLTMGLSGFGAGDYLIELTASGHGATDRKLLAIRVK